MYRQSPDADLGVLKNFLRILMRKYRVVLLKFRLKSKVIIRGNFHFGPNCRFMVPERIEIGNDVSIGADFFLQTNLRIGDDCLFSSRVSIVGHDHYLFDRERTTYWSGRTEPSLVTLEGSNFIGFGATIVGSVVIGRGSIVAAGAVVVKDVPENCVVAGVPARVIKKRFE
ncbi:MAG: acyltransferase [Vogesella sp.]|uniref:acyltransferase n=1 Tax=Vogesella sp. TaxID=1904252 RepID=UPI0039189F3B